jgi:peptidyl-prolyl isomerase E (cyclophilin E)
MSRKKNLLYVGGLEADTTEDILFAAFVPFGNIRSVQIPKDYKESEFY